jgi:predicted small secreted protein
MKTPLAVLMTALTLAGCSKTERGQAQDVERCSAVNTQAQLIALCLISDYGWNEADADAAAKVREHQLDSARAFQLDSIWSLDAAKHHEEWRRCSGDPQRMVECLILFGWPEERAVAAEESAWRADAPRHQRELQDCVRRQRGANIASCLMLYYKWPDRRALLANDSVQRAR